MDAALEATFGRRLALEHFPHHQFDLVRLNHGSFGACPASVLAVQRELRDRFYKNPDKFKNDELPHLLLKARTAVSEFVGCPEDCVCLVDNATTAASVVAQDVMWRFIDGEYKKGDRILLNSMTYGATDAAFKAYCQRVGAHIERVHFDFPVKSEKAWLQSFDDSLAKLTKDKTAPPIRMAVIDHIASTSSLLFNVKELARICRKYGVEEIFVDGAHAPGQVALDISQLDVDYYCGNLHKVCLFDICIGMHARTTPARETQPCIVLHLPALNMSSSTLVFTAADT
jgi:selenocysteine lyase/cysteine desulfurase